MLFRSNCEEQYDASFNIEDIKIEKKENHSNKIFLNNTVGVEMKYPKFDQVVKVFGSNNVDDVFKLIKKSISGIFDENNYWNASEQTDDEIEQFLLQLTKEQFDKLERFFMTSPKIVQVIECDCPKCGKHNVSRLEGLQNFFV